MATSPVRRALAAHSLGIKVTVSASAALALLAPCVAASADPSSTEASIAQVTQKLDTLARQSEMLTEQYDAANEDVAAKQHTAAQAKAAADAAVADYQNARSQLTSTIAAVYEGDSFRSTGALLLSSSGDNYIDTLNTLDVIGVHRSDLVTVLNQKKATADQATARANSTLAEARIKAAGLASQHTKVEASIKTYQTTLASLTAQQQAEYAQRDAATQQQLEQTRAVAAQATVAQQRQATQAGQPQAAQAQSAPAGSYSQPAVASTGGAVQTVSVQAGSGNAQAAVNFALAQVGKAYVYAASGPDAYDCSGLTMASWRQGGISLPHNAAAQYGYGTHVSVSQLRPGDLMFYYSPIGHVTIYVGNGMMVSAPQPGESIKLMPISAMMGDFVGATHLG